MEKVYEQNNAAWANCRDRRAEMQAELAAAPRRLARLQDELAGYLAEGVILRGQPDAALTEAEIEEIRQDIAGVKEVIELYPAIIEKLEARERVLFAQVQADQDAESKSRLLAEYLAVRDELVDAGRAAGKVPPEHVLDRLAGKGRGLGRRDEVEALLEAFRRLDDLQRYGKHDARLIFVPHDEARP